MKRWDTRILKARRKILSGTFHFLSSFLRASFIFEYSLRFGFKWMTIHNVDSTGLMAQMAHGMWLMSHKLWLSLKRIILKPYLILSGESSIFSSTLYPLHGTVGIVGVTTRDAFWIVVDCNGACVLTEIFCKLQPPRLLDVTGNLNLIIPFQKLIKCEDLINFNNTKKRQDWHR